MEWHEDSKTQFKREWAESIRKTVIAFANTEGGTLWVGVDEDCIRDMLREAGRIVKVGSGRNTRYREYTGPNRGIGGE